MQSHLACLHDVRHYQIIPLPKHPCQLYYPSLWIDNWTGSLYNGQSEAMSHTPADSHEVTELGVCNRLGWIQESMFLYTANFLRQNTSVNIQHDRQQNIWNIVQPLPNLMWFFFSKICHIIRNIWYNLNNSSEKTLWISSLFYFVWYLYDMWKTQMTIRIFYFKNRFR